MDFFYDSGIMKIINKNVKEFKYKTASKLTF